MNMLYLNKHCFSVAPIPGLSGSLAPIQSIADQIAALSKKKKKPEDDPSNLLPGRLIMSSCAKLTLVLSNLVFLVRLAIRHVYVSLLIVLYTTQTLTELMILLIFVREAI